MPKRILIRTDSSIQIGTGHVMRCLTLAHELRCKGAEVVFVCRENSGHLCNEIALNDFKVIRLKPIPVVSTRARSNFFVHKNKDKVTIASCLSVDQEIDASQTIHAIESELPWSWIIIDHYQLGKKWETALRGFADGIMVVDDLASRNHDADLLLDQNYFMAPANRYKSLLSDQCQMLLGPRYSLIRSDIEQGKKFCVMRSAGANRILVYFGGSDIDNLTAMAINALSSPKLKYLWAEVVIGPNNPHQKSIEKLIRLRKRTRLSIQPTAFTELMIRSDLCVGAGGTTTWERLCLGLPSIVVTVADNQEPSIRQLYKDGYLIWAGSKAKISAKDLERKIVDQVAKLNDLTSIPYSPNIVDGLGAKRVAEKMLPSSVQELRLRRSTVKDIEHYFFWANDRETRKNSFQNNPIDWEDHVQWFTQAIVSQSKKMWVLETSNGLPVGQVRFNSDSQFHTISFSLDPLVRGRKFGVKILQMGIEEMCRLVKCKAFIGKVKISNISSRKIFLKLGFRETVKNGIYTYTKKITGS